MSGVKTEIIHAYSTTSVVGKVLKIEAQSEIAQLDDGAGLVHRTVCEEVPRLDVPMDNIQGVDMLPTSRFVRKRLLKSRSTYRKGGGKSIGHNNKDMLRQPHRLLQSFEPGKLILNAAAFVELKKKDCDDISEIIAEWHA